MTKEERILAAHRVLNYKHLDTADAMERVLGNFTDDKEQTFAEVYEEIQRIRYPHGSGEDATYCEF